jgi:hypothetical protein
MSFEAFIWVPGLRGEFQRTAIKPTKQEAMQWLAQLVATHPDATRYGIDDNDTDQPVYRAEGL